MSPPPTRTSLASPPEKSVATSRHGGGLLSLAECRRILGRGCTLTDEEIETSRDQLTLLADAAIDAFLDGTEE